MLFKTGLEFIIHERAKYLGAVLGVTVALFLVLLLSGFYFGFKRDITIIQDSFAADVWIHSRTVLGFDFPAAFDDLVFNRIAGHPQVESCTRIVADFAKWRRPGDGAMENIQVVGYEPNAGIQANWGNAVPNLASRIQVDGQVLIDAKDAVNLGVEAGSDWGAEISGRSARMTGLMRDRRLFNVSCLIVTDLDNARAYLKMPAHSVHYIAVKCRAGADIPQVVRELQQALPENSVCTATEFHQRTQNYWQERTGIAPMLFLCMALSGVVGFLTTFLTFYLLTSQKLPVFAAMKAIGASTGEIGLLLGVQLGVVYCLACILAGLAILGALALLAPTPISVVMPGRVVVVVIGSMALASILACVPSLWKVARAEPAEAFRA